MAPEMMWVDVKMHNENHVELIRRYYPHTKSEVDGIPQTDVHATTKDALRLLLRESILLPESRDEVKKGTSILLHYLLYNYALQRIQIDSQRSGIQMWPHLQ